MSGVPRTAATRAGLTMPIGAQRDATAGARTASSTGTGFVIVTHSSESCRRVPSLPSPRRRTSN